MKRIEKMPGTFSIGEVQEPDEDTQPFVVDRRQRRSDRRADQKRLRLVISANLLASGKTAKMVVSNVSAGGLGGRCDIALPVGERVDINLSSIGCLSGEVIWSDGRRFGIEFDTPIDPAAVLPTHILETRAEADDRRQTRPFSAPQSMARRSF